MSAPFRRTIDVQDGQKIDMLSLDPRGNMAIKATDHPVVINREQAAQIINALGEAFEFPVSIVCGVVCSAIQVPGAISQGDYEILRERHLKNVLGRLRGEPTEGSKYAL